MLSVEGTFYTKDTKYKIKQVQRNVSNIYPLFFFFLPKMSPSLCYRKPRFTALNFLISSCRTKTGTIIIQCTAIRLPTVILISGTCIFFKGGGIRRTMPITLCMIKILDLLKPVESLNSDCLEKHSIPKTGTCEPIHCASFSVFLATVTST